MCITEKDKRINVRVFCKYDQQLDHFLKSIVEYVLVSYGNQLFLDDLGEIELIGDLPGLSDGRAIQGGQKIVLASRLFHELPTYDTSKLLNNENYRHIASTLFHEMGHASDMKMMPHIYAVAQNLENKEQMLPAFFWAEYLAEKRSSSANIASHIGYCEDFVNRKQQSYKFDFFTDTEENFFYLCKALAYYMGRTIDFNMRQKYCAKMRNPLLKSFTSSLDEELFVLESFLPFDDAEKLSNLSNIMDKYYLRFYETFTP